MKYNKLIPIIPVVATSIVVPIGMTSCDPKYVEPIEMHNLLEEYVPTSSKHEAAELNQTQATLDYVDAVNADPTIFYDDVCLAVQKLNQPEFKNDEPTWTLKEFMYGISKPKFGSTVISRYGSNDITYSTLTGRQKINLQYEATNGANLITIWDIELEVWYNDVVFYAYESETDPESNESEITWNLGLFDYSVGQEAIWPFVANMNPWSISYSCESIQSTYYVQQDQSRVLVNNKASYYSAMLDNGSKLINLINYYEEHKTPPEDHVMEWFLEQTAVSVILIDYQSRYFENVKNAPEIKLTHVLQNEYLYPLQEQNIATTGLIIILPTTIEDPTKVSIKVDNDGKDIVYSASERESPMYQNNQIRIEDGANIALNTGTPITEHRYNLSIDSRLQKKWVLPTSFTLPIDLYLTCNVSSFKVTIKYDDGDVHKVWEKQEVVLPYSYCAHRIASNN